MTDDIKQYIDSYIKQGLTVNTDEIEGQQVIELNNINLCNLDQEFSYTEELPNIDEIINNFSDDDTENILNKEPEELLNLIQDIHTDNRIIIEFANATVNDPNPVQYSIFVKPGQIINNDTIIGEVIQNDKTKQIKSIFDRATVMSTSDNSDYYRLYPDSCNRHIILTDCLSGSGHTIDISILETLNDNFKYEGYLYSLITNNMAQSLLPYVLSHRIRGIYKQQNILGIKGKWYFDESNSDLLMDTSVLEKTYIDNKDFTGNKQFNHPYIVYDNINENAANGVTIFDTSVLKVVEELQDQFGADMIGNDITSDDMKSWRKRAKKKKNRKKVKQEISEKVEAGTEKYKTDNPIDIFDNEKDRLLSGRSNYINSIIELYESKDKLPLCKYDEEYADCKFLVNNEIDENILKQTKEFDDEFSYIGIGDTEEYYNYYISLLSNINISNEDDKYSLEYYEIIKDIIDKRLIVEQCDITTLQRQFCDLYNENICENTFLFSKNENKNSQQIVLQEFNKLDLNISTYSSENNYSDLSEYMQVYNYIKSQIKDTNDEDNNQLVLTQLASMYTYIKSYGDGKNNKYKELKTDDDKYLYFKLVIEESNKICEFWDKIIALYKQDNMTTCMDKLYNIAYSFNNDAIWPAYTEIEIDGILYKHYLFENIYDKEYNDDNDLGIDGYTFPDHVDFPEIPDNIDVDEQWAINQLNSGDFMNFDNPNVISIKDFKYWQRYFALATLICLPPLFWNCGLDIIPFIQMIPLPCIFIAISSVYIRMFGIIIVFGIAIRGMYPWPIILYVNTTNQPISILTPLLVVIQQLKDVLNQKLNDLEMIQVSTLTKSLITLLENDSNKIKKENKKLDAYISVCKSMNIPNAESIKRQFEYITDPSIDMRQKIQRLETITARNRN